MYLYIIIIIIIIMIVFYLTTRGIRGSDASHTASPAQSSTSASCGIPCFNWRGSDARVTAG
jgi:hypothetical protein